jgi:hypothetical protein
MHYWDVAIKTQERGLNNILRDAFGPGMPSTDSGSFLHHQHQEKLLPEDFERDFLGSEAEILRHNVKDIMKQAKRPGWLTSRRTRVGLFIAISPSSDLTAWSPNLRHFPASEFR